MPNQSFDKFVRQMTGKSGPLTEVVYASLGGVNEFQKLHSHYLKAVRGRTKHLFEQTARCSSLFNEERRTAKKFQHLRDFFHYAYYAYFYSCRYILLRENHYDCVEHRSLPDSLSKLQNDRPEMDMVHRLISWRSDLVRHREIADYRPIDTNLSPDAFEDIKERIESLRKSLWRKK